MSSARTRETQEGEVEATSPSLRRRLQYSGEPDSFAPPGEKDETAGMLG